MWGTIAPRAVGMCTEGDGTVRIRVDQHATLSHPLLVEVAGVAPVSSSVCEGGTFAQAGASVTITMLEGTNHFDRALSF